mgnify:CR=1 FL=1
MQLTSAEAIAKETVVAHLFQSKTHNLMEQNLLLTY